MTALAVGLAASCGGSLVSAVPDGGEVIGCRSDPRVVTYTPDLTVSSATGAMRISLAQADPAPPARGTNTWTIRVADPSGDLLPGLTLAVVPFMPDHGHGTPVDARATFHPDGTYNVAPLNLFMPGVWKVTFTISRDAGPGDSAAFFFCIPG